MFQAINEPFLLWKRSDGVTTEGSDRFAGGPMKNEVNAGMLVVTQVRCNKTAQHN